jgi:hypothetical protein
MSDRELATFYRIAEDAAVQLLEELAAGLLAQGAAARVAVHAPHTGTGPDLPLDRIAEHIGTMVVIGDPASSEVRDAVHFGRSGLRHLEVEIFLHPPLAPSNGPFPTISHDFREPKFLQRMRDAASLRADSVGIYNYGLLTDTQFRELARLARTETAS